MYLRARADLANSAAGLDASVLNLNEMAIAAVAHNSYLGKVLFGPVTKGAGAGSVAALDPTEGDSLGFVRHTRNRKPGGGGHVSLCV